MLFFSSVESRLVLGEFLIAAFLIVTTPISFIVLAMAARQRVRSEHSTEPPE
jgi:multicomponent K+:H+ antiporter subunit G